MTSNKRVLGSTGEDGAARFLGAQGYAIVRRNYRTRFAEIDIIALDKGVICFVEVRSRSLEGFEAAGESVDGLKRRRLTLAATQYLKEQGKLEARARFDVVLVSTAGARPEYKLIQNAFEPEGDE